ncbi:phospholipase A [Vibrio stylophorae]
MNHANNKRITMALFAALLSAPVLAQGLQIHEENYFLPAYHESKVNQDRFAPMNPNGHEAKSTLIQFQLSLKYQLLSLNWNPLAQALNPQALNQQVHEQQPQDGIYVAYTQRSNWEAYDDSAYFRDHQYNPEIFYRIHGKPWQLTFGFEHDSNGAGGTEEVSWNRLYIDAKWQQPWGFIRFRPWMRVGDLPYNPNISDFLGYGEMEIQWQPTAQQSLQFQVANFFTDDWNKGFYRISWNFPLVQELRGYIKAETGYGLTISNYNFRDSAIGLGFAFGL